VGEYRLYVVELALPDGVQVGPKGAVGETGQTPEERFANHKAGGTAAVRIVHQYGVGLRPDLAPERTFESRAAALRGERRTAERQRDRGCRIWGGQGEPFMKPTE
jgi:hypothetical protein